MPADATLGIATLQYWLAVDGVTDTVCFPEDDSCNILNLEKKFHEFIRHNDSVIYALSCWSNSFTFAVRLARIVRELRPEACIIGGGAHFHSRENIEDGLKSGLFDIIFRGGGDPFFEFCTGLFKNNTLQLSRPNGKLTLSGTLPATGIHYMREGNINYTRHGVLSRAVVPVMHLTDSCAEITTLFDDKCGNNCDYCTVFKNASNDKTRQGAVEFVKEAYGQLKEVYGGPVKISIMDSSPFLDTNRQNTLAVIQELERLDNANRFSVFADPVDLDGEFLAFARTHNIETFFIGRDRLGEDPFIGRRLRGKLRTTEELELERRQLAAFISGMEGTSLNREIFIGYIASPYDTAEEALQLVEEFNTYSGAGENGVSVQPNIFLLNPYKGTTVGRKSQSIAWDVARFSYPYPNVWKGKDTPMLWLELLRLVVSPVFSTGAAWKEGKELLKFAASQAFGIAYQAVRGEGIFWNFLDRFISEVQGMGFGSEKTLEEWASNLLDLYYWGLILVASVKNPDVAEKYGYEKLKQYIHRYDKMVTLLKNDMEFIKFQDLGGTWYERYL